MDKFTKRLKEIKDQLGEVEDWEAVSVTTDIRVGEFEGVVRRLERALEVEREAKFLISHIDACDICIEGDPCEKSMNIYRKFKTEVLKSIMISTKGVKND